MKIFDEYRNRRLFLVPVGAVAEPGACRSVLSTFMA
jgi:hypothetical protein